MPTALVRRYLGLLESRTELAVARAGGALQSSQPPYGWSDNAALVTASTAGTVLASVSVAPRLTGKFRFTGSCSVRNSDTGGLTLVQLAIGHKDIFGAQQIDYTPGGLSLGVSVAMSFTTTFQSPLPFTLNTTVELDLILIGATSVTCIAHNAQFLVQELSS